MARRNPPEKDSSPGYKQYVWFDRWGYVRVQDLVRGLVLVYVLLTGVVTVLTSDLITLVFLGLIALLVVQFSSVDRLVPSRRRVEVFFDEGLYVAEHSASGTVRHGKTIDAALANLTAVFERRRGPTHAT